MWASPDTSKTVSAVWRASCYISQSLAGLPFMVRKADIGPSGRVRHIDQLRHPLVQLLNVAPNPEMTAFTFRELMFRSALLWGNGFAEIVRDLSGRVVGLWFIHPDRVQLIRDPNTLQLIYRISMSMGNTTGGLPQLLSPSDILHLKGPSEDGLWGESVVAYSARTLGLAIGQEEYGSSFFRNSAIPSTVLVPENKVSKEIADRLREQWDEKFQGSRKASKTAVLPVNMDVKLLTIPNEQAQFLESRRFSVEEIGRWFGVPPNKLFSWEFATYNNQESANREVVGDTLTPWATRMEQEVSQRCLNSGWGGLDAKHDFRGLLRGDPEGRAKYYESLFGIGSLNSNEVRESEGMNPHKDGERYFIQGNNYIPMDRVDEMDRVSGNGSSTNQPEPESEDDDDGMQET